MYRTRTYLFTILKQSHKQACEKKRHSNCTQIQIKSTY